MKHQVDNVLFLVPHDLEAALAALTTIQDYIAHRVKNEKARWTELELNVYVKLAESAQDWRFLFEQLPRCEVVTVDTIWRNAYDLVFEFNAQRAYKFSSASQRHMVQAFGLQLGLDPKILPDLTGLDQKKLHGMLYGLEECVGVYLGTRSGVTYLACALGLPIVEIYPTDKHRYWLSKWSHPLYTMIYENNPSMEVIDQAREAMCVRHSQLQQLTNQPVGNKS